MPSLFRMHTMVPPAMTVEEFTVPFASTTSWVEEASDGELVVDVYEDRDRFVVLSTVAGVQPGDLTLSLHRDLLTIRGTRAACLPEGTTERNPLTRECYWGSFSRSVLFPEPVDTVRASATLRHGVLTITLPKLVERTDIGIEHVE